MAKEELTWEQVEEMFKFNERLVNDINAAKSNEEANATLKAYGVEASIEDIIEVISEIPLTEEELEKVSGGMDICTVIFGRFL